MRPSPLCLPADMPELSQSRFRTTAVELGRAIQSKFGGLRKPSKLRLRDRSVVSPVRCRGIITFGSRLASRPFDAGLCSLGGMRPGFASLGPVPSIANPTITHCAGSMSYTRTAGHPTRWPPRAPSMRVPRSIGGSIRGFPTLMRVPELVFWVSA
jgi:hypothetical protein